MSVTSHARAEAVFQSAEGCKSRIRSSSTPGATSRGASGRSGVGLVALAAVGLLSLGLRAQGPEAPAGSSGVETPGVTTPEVAVPDGVEGPGAPSVENPSVIGGQEAAPQDPEASEGSEAGIAEAAGELAATAPESATVDATRETPDFFQVRRSGLPLRGLPIEQVPSFPGELAVGDVVWADGPVQNDYQPVRLPGGAMGFVHSRFVEVDDDGRVRVEDGGIPLRHMPAGGSVPIVMLTRGTELWIVGREGEWLEVREPARRIFLPADALVAAPTDSTSKRAVDDAKSRAEARTAAYLEAQRVLHAQAEARKARVDQAEALRQRVLRESDKDTLEQNWGPISADIVSWLSAADPNEANYAFVSGQLKDVKIFESLHNSAMAEQRLLEQKEILVEENKPLIDAIEPERRPLSDYEQGWLRVERPVFGETTFWLESGGQKKWRLQCSSGRYALEDFEGHHVAVKRGSSEMPEGQSRVLDLTEARAIYVLGGR